ncbi:hypothetical protein ACH36K_10465 [Clostridium sp. MB05]|uniref:hypothetical protein n=1 Tax=Clostridium sp. MB05 TaxID=3376682 RepID=UPI003981F788
MGKFKELYIKYSNLDRETKEVIKLYSQEYITDKDNKKVSLAQYILKSNNYICEVQAIEETAHLWTWSDFRREAKARVLSYKTETNVILSQLLEFYSEPDLELLNKYGLEIVKTLN